MKELNIDWDKQRVKHKGVDIDLIDVKNLINELAPKLVISYRFDARFNNKTGEIYYKYAWDSIFFKFHKSFGLKNLFDIILKTNKVNLQLQYLSWLKNTKN